MKYKHTIAILAYNSHDLTMQVLKELYKTNLNSKILFFDNGSEPSFEKLIDGLNIQYHRELKNIFVNPAWNKIFEMTDTEYLTLLNNDCLIMSKNYFEDIIPNMKKNDIILSSCYTKNIKTINWLKVAIYKFINYVFYNNKLSYLENTHRQGWLMTINLKKYKTMNYIIPSYLKIWFGDDWIWGQIKKNGHKAVVYNNRLALHVKSTTTTSNIIKEIIDKDLQSMIENGSWLDEVSNLIHNKKNWLEKIANLIQKK